jgi:membrane protein
VPRLTARALYHGFIGFYNSDDLTYASSIAYYALLSLFPMLLLALSLLGAATANEHDRTAVVEFLLRYFPRQLEFVTAQLDAFRGSRHAIGIGGVLVLVWASLGFFGALTSAVNHAWGVEKQFTFWKHKLVSFLMLVAAGVLTFAALLLISMRGIVSATWFAKAAAHLPWLVTLTSIATTWTTTVTLVFVVGLIFYFVPNAKIRFKDVWVGAIVTGLLWRLALYGFSWYVRDLSRFSIHGSIAAVVVFLVWVYVCSVILLYGVEFTVAYARLRRLIPDDETPPVPPASAPEPEPGQDPDEVPAPVASCEPQAVGDGRDEQRAHANQIHKPITKAPSSTESTA